METHGPSSTARTPDSQSERIQDRALAPFSSPSPEANLPMEPSDAALYQAYIDRPQPERNDVAYHYENWADSRFRVSPNISVQSLKGPNPPPLPSGVKLGNDQNHTLYGERAGESSSMGNDPNINNRIFTAEGSSGSPREPSLTRLPSHPNDPGNSNDSFSPQPPTSQSRYRRALSIPERPEVVVPRWQQDAEVTLCPICRTQFSFFVRKHHCRKCGRVVCNSCSPHRITIPYQYIVQQPVEGAPTPSESSRIRPARDTARQGSTEEVANLGGGERVRLCNPCVPDPNIAPPQTPSNSQQQLSSQPSRHHGRSISGASALYNSYQRNLPQGRPQGQTHIHSNPGPISRRARQPSILNTSSSYSHQQSQPRGSPYASGDSRLGSDSVDIRSRSSTVGTSRVIYNMSNQQSIEGSSSHPITPILGQRYSTSMPRDEGGPSRPPPQLPRPGRVIDESDECWICHLELPSRALTNFENLREEHVNACLASAQAPSSSPPPNTPPTVSGASSSSTPGLLTSSHKRRSALFSYTATEKDCVDDAECTICLEEFEVGQKMGRLECFCRFHQKCILDWFASRPGQCPVHQHDGGW